MRHPAVDAFFVCRVWAFSKGRLFTCRQLFLTPYNRRTFTYPANFHLHGYFHIPILLTVFANRLYIVAVITVLLSLTYRSMQNAQTWCGREGWKLLSDCLFRRDGYSGGLIRFCLSTKTFPILCTIYNKVETKYSSVLNCKTVLR